MLAQIAPELCGHAKRGRRFEGTNRKFDYGDASLLQLFQAQPGGMKTTHMREKKGTVQTPRDFDQLSLAAAAAEIAGEQ